jgi:gluconolactonase
MQLHVSGVSRRAMMAGAGSVAAFGAKAQTPSQTAAPPNVITNPPRQWGRWASPDIYPDPDVIVIDPAFRQVRVGNAPLRRVATGFEWAEASLVQ